MKIKIDGKEMIVTDPNKNIVEIGDDNGVKISAPCFRSKKKHGCCNACVVEVDGIQKYACGTKPHDGMNIIYNREDLEGLRKERLDQYAQAIKSDDIGSNACCGTDPNNPFTVDSSCGCSASSYC